MVSSAKGLTELYRNALIPKSKQDFEAAFANYSAGRGDALTVMTRLKSLLEFEFQYWSPGRGTREGHCPHRGPDRREPLPADPGVEIGKGLSQRLPKSRSLMTKKNRLIILAAGLFAALLAGLYLTGWGLRARARLPPRS